MKSIVDNQTKLDPSTGEPREPIILSPGMPGKNARHYLIRPEGRIGEGSLSTVYRAERVNVRQSHALTAPILPAQHVAHEQTGEFFAVKIIKHGDLQYQESEVDVLKQIQFTEDPVKQTHQSDDTSVYIVTKLIPGLPLQLQGNASHTEAFDLQNLTALQRVELAWNMVREVHRIQTRYADHIIHCDIKPSNFHIENNNGHIQAKLVDWGFAMVATHNKPIRHPQTTSTGFKGNPTYHPYEALNGRFGTKTDIYTLVHPIAYALGQPDPCHSKFLAHQQDKRWNVGKNMTPSAPFAPFDIDQLIDFSSAYGDWQINKTVTAFLNRMQSKRYAQRPDVHETRLFFHSLYRLLWWLEKSTTKNHHHDLAKIEKKIHVLLTKLHLLSSNQWNKPINNLCFPGDTSSSKLRNIRPYAVRDFNFDAHPDAARYFLQKDVAHFRETVSKNPPRTVAIDMLSQAGLASQRDKATLASHSKADNLKRQAIASLEYPKITTTTKTILNELPNRADTLHFALLALRNQNWVQAARLLMILQKSPLTAQTTKPMKELVKMVNSHRPALVDAILHVLDQEKPACRETAVQEIEQGKSLLGSILKKPQNNFFYLFSRKTHHGKKVTGSLKKILDTYAKKAPPKKRAL